MKSSHTYINSIDTQEKHGSLKHKLDSEINKLDSEINKLTKLIENYTGM